MLALEMIEARLTDSQLVDLCRQGQARGWDALVARYARLVYAIARELASPGNGGEPAAEVSRAVFGALYRHLTAYVAGEDLADWLIETTRQECLRRIASTHLADGMIQRDGLVAQRVLSTLKRQHLIRLGISRLAARCQILLNLTYYDPARPSAAEVARRLGLAELNLPATRARCLRHLHHTLNNLGFLWSEALAGREGDDLVPEKAPITEHSDEVSGGHAARPGL